LKYTVCTLAELPAGGMRRVLLDRVAVVVIRKDDGELRALRDVCPHMGARLSRGGLQKMVVGDQPGEREMSDQLVLRCPWHGQEFDLDSGECEADPGQRVRVYPVSVEEGRVVVERRSGSE
jgi:nitrite reductase (NADH) small subunit